MKHFIFDILRFFFLDLVLYQPYSLLMPHQPSIAIALLSFVFSLFPHDSHQHCLVLAEFTSSGSAMATLANTASPRESPQGQAQVQLFQENKKN